MWVQWVSVGVSGRVKYVDELIVWVKCVGAVGECGWVKYVGAFEVCG